MTVVNISGKTLSPKELLAKKALDGIHEIYPFSYCYAGAIPMWGEWLEDAQVTEQDINRAFKLLKDNTSFMPPSLGGFISACKGELNFNDNGKNYTFEELECYVFGHAVHAVDSKFIKLMSFDDHVKDQRKPFKKINLDMDDISWSEE